MVVKLERLTNIRIEEELVNVKRESSDDCDSKEQMKEDNPDEDKDVDEFDRIGRKRKKVVGLVTSEDDTDTDYSYYSEMSNGYNEATDEELGWFNFDIQLL